MVGLMLDHARKADEIAGDLMARIVSGELAVGELLPREAFCATLHYPAERKIRSRTLYYTLLGVHSSKRATLPSSLKSHKIH